MVLAADLYVDNAADFTITNDQGSIGLLDAGDTVTWGTGDTAVAGLTFGTTAFGTLPAAVTAASPGDTIFVAAGTYAPITIGVAGITVMTTAGALIQGADAEGATVRFAANNVRLEGFTIDNQNAADGRAVAPQGSSGGQIVGNTIKNAVRGIQGDFYGRPTDVTITGNTFESTVAYGIAGTEDMSITALSGNTFNTSEEAIGLGAGVSGVTPAGLMTNNTFSLSAAGDGDTYGVKDYASTPNTIYVKAGDSLQAAINGASEGDTILVAAGTYTGSLNVLKRLHLIGAGSGDNPATDTIIVSTDSSTAAITVSGSGTDADERLSIEGLRVTGGNDGIRIDGAAPVAHLTFTDVVATDNTDSGIHFRGTGSVSDVVIEDTVLSSNDNNGIRIASAVSSIIGLSVTDTAINDNGYSGFSFNPVGTLANVGDDFSFTDVTFSRNNAGNNNNAHDVSFFGFHGDATLTRVTIDASNTRAYAVVFTNASASTAAGSIVLEDVDITGTVGKAGLSFQYYNDVSAISLSNVDVSGVTAPWGQIALFTQNAAPFHLGNTTLVSLALWSTGDVDATEATFKNAAGGGVLNRDVLTDNFTIANQVVDAVDVSALGTVRWHESYGYVTPTSFSAPHTTTPSIQRAIDAATPGDTIFVAAGTYAPITIGVAGITVMTTAGALIQGADAEGATVRFAANNVRLEGFTIDNDNAADGRAVAPQGFSGGQIVGNTIKNAVRGIQGDFYGRPTDVTITGNTFESTVAYGIAGTEGMSIAALSGNTFNTSEEAIGLGAGVSGVTLAGLMADNTFSLSAAGDGDTYGVKDYRDNTIYVKAGDSLQAAINGATFGDTVLVAAGTWSPITIGVAGVTVKTTAGALIQGADAEGVTVRFAANNVRLEGFTIDNDNAADGRAVAPQGFSGGQIVGNTIKNAVRGIQGDFYGRPTDVTITGNTFESTVAYGIAGTEGMSIAALSGNIFNTSEEAIGLGAGVSGVTPAGLMANNTFNLSAAGDGDTYGVKDYRDNTIYVKAGDSLQAAINGASVGDTILVSAGTYAPISIPDNFTSLENLNRSFTVKSIAGAATTIIQGADADGITVRVGYVHPYYVPRVEGFTIDNQNATDGAAIVTAGFAGGSFVNNTILNAARGIQGGGYNWLTITGNTFESTVTRGIVGTDYSLISAISGNTFSTSVEAISLNANVSWRPDPNDSPRQLDASGIYDLLAAQTFDDYAGDALRDYRTFSTYVPVRLTTDSGASASDRITSDGSLTVTPAIGETIEYSVDNGLTWSDSFTAVEGPNAVMARRVGSTRTDSEPKAFAFTLDTVKPAVAIAASRDGLPVAALKAGETATITFTLSESSTSFTVDDVSVARGELSRFTGSGSIYTATFTPAVDTEAEAAVSVAANTFTDTAGNQNLASSDLTLQVDTVVPTVEITSSRDVLKANQTALITFTLNTPSTTFTAGDVVTTGGTLSNFAGSGSAYTATFTPTANFSGVGTVRVLAGSFFDLAGNRSIVAFDLSPTIDVQTDGPYVVSITAATNPIRVGAGTSQITVTLNKYVPAFTLAHLEVTPGAGTFGTLNRVGSSASYRTLFTPAANYVGTVAITVADNAFADTAGNWNVGGSSAPLVVDLVAPDITSITPSLTSLKAGETTPVTFSFNEPVVGFTLSDVTVSGGTLSGFTGSGTSYSALFTPRTNSTTAGTISVAANRFTDAAGNPNVLRDLSPPIAINTVVPSMTIRQRLPVLKAGQSTTVTFQVRGQVSGSDPFTAADISLSSEQGLLTNFSGPSIVRGISTYTALYTAPATAFSGSVGLSVPANSFKVVGNDVNGNALATLAIKIDAIAPTPVISSTATALKIGQTATIDFTVDGEIGGLLGFEAGDITLTAASGTLSAPTRVGSTSVYRSTYTPAFGFTGTVTIALAAGKFTDAAGNPNTIAAPITIAVDTLAPTAPVVSLVNDSGVLGTDTITSDAQLQTTGIEAGAAVNYWTTSALTTSWTPALAVQGSNTVYVTQTDTAGNPSPSTAFTFQYRTTAPVVTSITLPAASTGLRASAFLQLSVRFDRPVFVTNATADGPFITIGGFTTGANNRNAVYSSGSGTTTLVFRYRVVAGDKALAGITFSSTAIALSGATLSDAAGNAAALGFTLPSRRPLTRVNA